MDVLSLEICLVSWYFSKFMGAVDGGLLVWLSRLAGSFHKWTCSISIDAGDGSGEEKIKSGGGSGFSYTISFSVHEFEYSFVITIAEQHSNNEASYEQESLAVDT